MSVLKGGVRTDVELLVSSRKFLQRRWRLAIHAEAVISVMTRKDQGYVSGCLTKTKDVVPASVYHMLTYG